MENSTNNKNINHNKTIRTLEQKLEEKQNEFQVLLQNFQKLKDEYEKQFYKMQDMEKQIILLTNTIQTCNDSEDEDITETAIAE